MFNMNSLEKTNRLIILAVPQKLRYNGKRWIVELAVQWYVLFDVAKCFLTP